MAKPGALKDHKAEVLQMRASGIPLYKIAAHFGVAPFSVTELVRRHEAALASAVDAKADAAPSEAKR